MSVQFFIIYFIIINCSYLYKRIDFISIYQFYFITN